MEIWRMIVVLNVLSLSFVLAATAEGQSGTFSGALSDVRLADGRAWNGTAGDCGSIHSLGNGYMCVYQQGPDIIQIFGPPYSAPSSGRITLEGENFSCLSRRIWGAAIWRHEIAYAGNDAAVFTDFVASGERCFVRMIQNTEPVTLLYTPEPNLRVADYVTAAMLEEGARGGVIIETPIGRPLVPFGLYPLPFAVFNHLAWKGDVVAERTDDGLRLTFAPGQSLLYVSGGPKLDQCIRHMEKALASTPDFLLESTMAAWRTFSSHGTDFEATLPHDVPMRERLVHVLDDVAVMLKAQQAVEGGIIAGYPYHMGYVRDQYGIHRGLISLGHDEMARDILEFYHDIFDKGSQIRNAQAFGIPGVYHVHENDDVEITGYIIIQAFDYLKRSGDVDFMLKILPLLEWAWEAQLQHLVEGMLPFNGDETYIAGGIFPRSAINDGSAEATLLFFEGGMSLLDFVNERGLWDNARIAVGREKLIEVQNSFRANFWHDERLLTNNPVRAAAAEIPQSRHGVCEQCINVHWTRRTPHGRYICVTCLDEPTLLAVEPEVFSLQSVSLTPLYFRATRLLEKDDLRPQVEAIFNDYERTGSLPSRPGSNVTIGYDYGLLLYGLTELGHPKSREFYEKTLGLTDATGVWAEYHLNHRPVGTRCRPWDSAINVEAILHWVASEYAQ